MSEKQQYSGNASEKEAEKVILNEGEKVEDKIVELEKKISRLFEQEKFNIIIDMQHIRLMPTRFIIALIKFTSQARRCDGDVRLINMGDFARNNLVTFTPSTYLSMEPSELYALQDFGESVEPDLVVEEKVEPILKKADETGTQNKPEVSNVNEEDDESVEVLQSLKLNDSHKIRIHSSADSLYKACDFVVQQGVKAGFHDSELAKLKVTVYEAGLNIIEHAYHSNPDYLIDVYALAKDGKFFIVIQDWGTGFDFDPERDYDVEEAVRERKTGGFGLHIIKRTVDQIYYLKDIKIGNRLILIKNINAKIDEQENVIS